MRRSNLFGMEDVFDGLGIVRKDLSVEGLVEDESTSGVLRKTLVRVGDDLYHVKSGISDFGEHNVRYPITEVMCYRIGKLLGFNVIPYELVEVDASYFVYEDDSFVDEDSALDKYLRERGTTLVSVSKSFVKEPYERFYHASLDLSSECKGMELFNSVKEMQGITLQGLGEMMLFDYLIHNYDRHTNNFGFIVSKDVRMAPLYDNGFGLLSSYNDREIEEDWLELTANDHFNPFGMLRGFELLEREAFRNVRFDVGSEDINLIVDKYKGLLSPIRLELIKTLIGTRWEYVKNLLS